MMMLLMLLSRTGSWRLFPDSASSWVILVFISLYCKGKIKATELFKLAVLCSQHTTPLVIS